MLYDYLRLTSELALNKLILQIPKKKNDQWIE